jgi:hypothetical protein
MLTGKKLYVLADIENVLDPDTGDRKKQVTKAKKLVNKIELVGVQTAQLGQTQGFNLAFSVTIARVHYNKEKYLYFDGQVYEIKSMGKAKHETEMLLHVQLIKDADMRTAIECWLTETGGDEE